MQKLKNKEDNKKCKKVKTWQNKLRLYASTHLVFLCFLFTVYCLPFTSSAVFAEGTYTLKTGISIDKVPKDFYGTWRVSSKLLSTNSDGTFKEGSVDLWNLSRVGDVITLDNPFSGAKASIVISDLKDRAIKFKKIGDEEGKKLSDTVQLVLGKDTFKGINNLKLDTISELDGHVIRTEWATYSLVGEKISGEAIK
jgi:hypothetical protein